ncbi:NADH-quinone oxidoreductase subunit NuoE family protein [Tindallia californiensis]|uniref:NADH-quinone oxidoreductase subunit E n=1 Tax=Tindallia californiensis TaxID=159292 RepID=A0A1H3QFP5_9FIRM|nr:NAD(P)H-dependent oxidoreductase subunit E [Tindallia californiensis]SDZ12322.1 NADH-quinone oxidoreductase subunit E [Tindallia californiensis]
MEQVQKETLDRILESSDSGNAALIPIMQEIQSEYRYLPRYALEYIAEKMDISIAKIYSVASFYENFSLEPKGKYIIRVCDGTACHVRKSIPILNALRANLSLTDEKHTTDDMLFTVEAVSCLGACGLAPVIAVNEEMHAAMTPEKVQTLLADLRKEGDADESNC